MVGTSGSGKTALAQRLAEQLAYPYVELDALHWKPDWKSAPDDEFRPRVTQLDSVYHQADWTPLAEEEFRRRVGLAADGSCWVIDGSYSKVRDIVWRRADTMVWLDYALPLILWRLTRRTFGRMLTRQKLWAGNREDLRIFLSRDSILLWALQTYRSLRRTYSAVSDDPAWTHLTVVRLRSPRATAAWLAGYSTTK